jgi:hypothetical protein
MSGTLVVQNLQGPASGANANKIIVPAGQVLDASAGFVAPAGSVIQVVTDVQVGEQSTTSTSFTNTSLAVTITPTSATSKMFLLYTGSAGNNGVQQSYLTITRGATNLGNGVAGLMRIWFDNSTSYHFSGMSMSFLDSPATTSATTYTVQFRTTSGIAYVSSGNSTDLFTVMEIAQ